MSKEQQVIDKIMSLTVDDVESTSAKGNWITIDTKSGFSIFETRNVDDTGRSVHLRKGRILSSIYEPSEELLDKIQSLLGQSNESLINQFLES